MPSPAPKPKDFAVHWSDSNQPVSDYTGITGSSLDGGFLFLVKWDREFIINMDEVRIITIRDQKGK